MNYILSKIDQRINLLNSLGKKQELKTHLQSKLEFYLIFILGYLWNKNLKNISDEKKEEVLNIILKPSIGSIISLSRTLDIDAEIFGNKKLNKLRESIDKYPNLRNEQIGHGYTFEDEIDSIIISFMDILELFQDTNSPIFEDHDLIFVSSLDDGFYKGINYKANGSDYTLWTCPIQVQSFEVNSLYIKYNNNTYFRLSPFIIISDDSEFYTFSSIEEKLTGRTKFNQLLKTSKLIQDLPELTTINVSEDRYKIKTSNGTIINKFSKDWKKYIDVGISNQITNFLTKNQSSVFATLWGHGGIGKTSAIQNVCEELSQREYKKFDYIIFLSAKDRYYNYYKGVIEELQGNFSSYNEIIEFINRILFDRVGDTTEENILQYDGKVLLIIDDFETFRKDDKTKITNFIQKLNINYHKVILTTRSATLITGVEIESNELSENKTIDFLISAAKNEFPEVNFDKDYRLFKKYSKQIFEITSGRPLFILQFLILYMQNGSITETLLVDIKSLEQARSFLYDRIYDYLSPEAKNMFLGINLLVSADDADLTGLIVNLKFILNKEDDSTSFDNSLNELIKLRIIERLDHDFFKVYSPEILKLMRVYYEKKGKEYDGDVTNRYNLIKSGEKLETDYALLKIADSKRLEANDTEVENQYRRIIKRESAKYEVRLKALFNYASYLFSQKGQASKAIKLFSDYWHWFKSDAEFNINNSKFHWAEGSSVFRYKAIDILENYLTTKPRISEETYFEILGTQMTYSSIMLVSERNELKDKRRFKEISERQYDFSYSEQRNRFNKLYNYPGSRLYDLIRDKDLMELKPKCRNLVLDGLTHYVEICIRLNKHEKGREVCDKIISELPTDYHKPFVFKVNKIESITNDFDDSSEIIDYKKNQSNETLLSARLREAFDKK
ncbi:NB-ARC domain-containing protein [Chryseobacterium foetidum]|uniref:NB-ARC domain-containing protein n=1 Tax=Chryseobacterium foetidum TaxID=2951057 RepID=UPI0021C83921|nr:NB-ARC domain-containing protein [Chryseobacterium foetidum]